MTPNQLLVVRTRRGPAKRRGTANAPSGVTAIRDAIETRSAGSPPTPLAPELSGGQTDLTDRAAHARMCLMGTGSGPGKRCLTRH
jgi:hypothetical protein